MKYIFFLLLFVSSIATAQTKTKVNMGSKNTIVMFADGLGADSVLMYPTGCGAPGNITRYTTAQNKSAFYHDSCSGLSYYYNIKTDEWASFVTPSIINSNPVYIVQDSLNAQPVSPDDSTYWLTGGSPTGTDWAGHPNAIAFYNGTVWSFPAITTGDNAFTLDTYVWHQYNGGTWPISTGYVLINGGNPQPVIMGSTVAQNVSLVYNKTERIKFVGAGMNFTQMTGTGLGIAQFGANGRVMRTEPASSSDTTTYKPLAISTAGDIVRASYWPGSGGGGGSQTWQQTLTTGSTLTGNNTITATGFAYTHNGAQFTRNLTDSILDAAPKISFAATDSLNGRSPIIYYKGGTVTFGGTTKAIIFKDSTFAEFKADGIRMSALTTGTTGSIMRQDAGGFLVKGATINAATELLNAAPEANGGTNQTTYATGDILYATGTNTLGKRSIGTTGQVYTVSGGVGVWATPTTSPFTRGVLPSASATLNVIYPTTQADTVYIGPTGTLASNKPLGLFNVSGRSYFQTNVGIGAAPTSTYLLDVGGDGRVQGNFENDGRASINTFGAAVTAQALTLGLSNGSNGIGLAVGTNQITTNTNVSGIKITPTINQTSAATGTSFSGLWVVFAQTNSATPVSSQWNGAKIEAVINSTNSTAITSYNGILGTAVHSSGTQKFGTYTFLHDSGYISTSGTTTLTTGDYRTLRMDSVNNIRVGGNIYFLSSSDNQNRTIISTIGGKLNVGSESVPTSYLQTTSFAAGYVAKTANYTATINDYTIECTANTFQVTLPTAVGIAGRIYNIVNSGAGTITIGTTSSQTFVNVVATPTTLTLAAVGNYSLQSNGANWMVIN